MSYKMVKYIFSFNGNNITIVCKKEDKLKNVLSEWYSGNEEINPNNIILLYIGEKITN
jgi:hypothetical protein